MQGSDAAKGACAVLVADDDAVCRQFCAHALAATRYTPVIVDDADSAIQAALQIHPALIIMDLHLPDRDACTVIRRVLDGWPAARAECLWLGMTARDEPAAFSGMLAAGFHRVLAKPFTAALLQALAADQRTALPRLTPGPSTVLEQRLHAAFLADLPTPLADLDEAFSILDWPRCESILHRICGSAAMAGFPQLARRGRALAQLFQQPLLVPRLAETYLEFLSGAADLAAGEQMRVSQGFRPCE
ncbi:MAG: Hpt domain-containing response regulator [Lysobacterales bacterium]